MANYLDAPRQLSSDEYMEQILEESRITTNFGEYEIIITDVEQKYLNWKYTPLYKPITVFKKLPSKEVAEEVYNLFVERGFRKGGYDELDYNKRDNCSNIFIIRSPQKGNEL